MTDHTELVARLRKHRRGPIGGAYLRQAADALEAQAQEIAEWREIAMSNKDNLTRICNQLAEAEALLETVAPLAYAHWKRAHCDSVSPVMGAIEPIMGNVSEADANAPWLTQAHMICTDHGIPQGNISDRLEMLVGYLAEAERDAALGRIAMRFVDRAGDYCDVDPAERICDEFYRAMGEEVERQWKERIRRDAAMEGGE